jgi:hypothetical protein
MLMVAMIAVEEVDSANELVVAEDDDFGVHGGKQHEPNQLLLIPRSYLFRNLKRRRKRLLCISDDVVASVPRMQFDCEEGDVCC